MALQSRTTRVVLLAGALATLLNFVCIAYFGSKVFFYDEWDGFVGMLNQISREGFHFQYFWTAHNEHRILVSKLAYYFQSWFSTDPRWQMVLSSIVWFLALRELTRGLALEVHGRIGIAIAFFAGLFFFSEIQAENFFWGFQLCWFLATWGGIGAIRAAIEKNYLRMWVYFALTYFSLASWPVLIPTLALALAWNWWKGDRKLAPAIPLILFILISVAALVLYVHGAEAPQHAEFSLPFYKDPLRFFAYAALLIGVPFGSMGFVLDIGFGILFFLCLIWLWRRHREQLTTFEFFLIVHAVIAALVIARGRAGAWQWGHTAAFRYATIFIPSWLALLSISLRIFSNRKRALITILVIMIAFVFDSAMKGIDHEGGANRTRSASGECLKRVVAAGGARAAMPEDLKCAMLLYHDETFIDRAFEWKGNGRAFF